MFAKIYLNKADFEGISMYYRIGSNDKSVINDVITNKEYLNYDLQLTENSTVVDIGAHIGSFAIQASKIATAGRVYAFEPFSENYLMAKKNIALNKCANIVLHNQGVLDQTRKIKFFVSNSNTGCHGIHERDEKASKIIEIDCIGFNSFIELEGLENIDLLKLDCEGSEYEILMKSDLRLIHKIILEYHEFPNIPFNLELLKNHLKSQGFELIKDVRYSSFPIGVGVAFFKRHDWS
jgi:FkbM family methyltransferase